MLSKIEISHKTVFFIAAFLAGLWLLYQIKDIIFLLFVAFVLMSGLRPIVDRLERLKFPRAIAVILIYIFVFGFLGVGGSFLLQPVVAETVKFITQLATYISERIPFVQLQLNDVITQIGPLGQNLLSITVGIFSNIVTLFTLLIFTFYLLIERKHLGVFLQEWVGEETGRRVIHTINHIEQQLGGWIRGQITLMVVIGVMVYIGLSILGIPFALALGVIAGLLEVVPNIGPILSAVPAIIVAFIMTSTPNVFLAIAVGALYFIVQQLENTLVVPFVMRRVVGVPPLVTIITLLIGGRLAGVAGVLFAVPFVLIVKTIVTEFWLDKEKK